LTGFLFSLSWPAFGFDMGAQPLDPHET